MLVSYLRFLYLYSLRILVYSFLFLFLAFLVWGAEPCLFHKRSLVEVLLCLFYQIICIILGVFVLWRFDRIHLWIHVVLGIFLGNSLMTYSLSFSDIGLFKYSTSSTVNLGNLHFLNIHPYHLDCYIYFHTVARSNF